MPRVSNSLSSKIFAIEHSLEFPLFLTDLRMRTGSPRTVSDCDVQAFA